MTQFTVSDIGTVEPDQMADWCADVEAAVESFPDPTGETAGQAVVTDGDGGYTLGEASGSEPVGAWEPDDDEQFLFYVDRDRVWFGDLTLADAGESTTFGTMPTGQRPASNVQLLCRAFDGSAFHDGIITVATTGVVSLETDPPLDGAVTVFAEHLSYRITRSN